MTRPDPQAATGPAPGTPEAVGLALLNIGIMLAPILEATNGYKATLLADGWSVPAAEQMAIDYHRHLLGSAFKATAGG